MTFAGAKLKEYLLFASLLGLLALWNIPHTITARYLCAAVLFLIVVVSRPGWNAFFRDNRVLLVFFAYLIIHLVFFSTDFEVALGNFRGDWLKLILFTVLGAGTGLVVSRGFPGRPMFYMGLGFSVPLLIHLGLALIEGWKRGAVPWAYWGIHEIHGDLGYTALHTAIFLSGFLLYQARGYGEKALSVALLLACIVSPWIAGSRGGVGFVILAFVVVSLTNLAIRSSEKVTVKRQLLVLLAILLALVAIIRIGAVYQPVKWSGMVERMEMGLRGDPIEVNCKGTGVLKKMLEDEGRVITPEITEILRNVNEGDGARVMTARAALRLLADHPMGIDQSKQAYQIALAKICEPVIRMAHAHNGWIDSALAIGIPGALLYFLVLLNYSRLGLRSMKLGEANLAYSVALFTMSTIWIVRSFVDSAQRDQMLQMQVFAMAFLYGFIVNREKNPAGVRSA
jgi:O-antigen ligase